VQEEKIIKRILILLNNVLTLKRNIRNCLKDESDFLVAILIIASCRKAFIIHNIIFNNFFSPLDYKDVCGGTF
jgi:hypothetical protein